MPDHVARDGDKIEETVATVGGDSAAAVSPVAVYPVAATFLLSPRMRQSECLSRPLFCFICNDFDPLILIVYLREKENDEDGRRYYCRAVHAGGAAA